MVFALAAIVVIGTGAVAGFRTELLPAAARHGIAQFSILDERATMALAVGGILLLWAVTTRWMKVEPERTGWLSDRRWEDPEREPAVAGQELTAAFDAKARGDTQSEDPVQTRLRDLLITVHARELGSTDAAEAYVDSGQWTSDRYAGAFVTASGEVDFPWYHRLYGWLYPGPAYEQRISRTLTAVERICDERLVSYSLPDDRRLGRPTRYDRLKARLGLEPNQP